MSELLKHTLEPMIEKESRVLILGSFPSVVSREKMFYYANPRNRFWPVLAKVYEEEIIDKKEFCHRHHIALWDVIASCTIHASDDGSIDHVTCNDIAGAVKGTDIRAIFTTGAKAAALYRKYIVCDLPHIALPSTSSANAAMKEEDLLSFYKVIKGYTDEKD